MCCHENAKGDTHFAECLLGPLRRRRASWQLSCWKGPAVMHEPRLHEAMRLAVFCHLNAATTFFTV